MPATSGAKSREKPPQNGWTAATVVRQNQGLVLPMGSVGYHVWHLRLSLQPSPPLTSARASGFAALHRSAMLRIIAGRPSWTLIVGLSLILKAPPRERKRTKPRESIFNKFGSQLGRSRAAVDRKASELRLYSGSNAASALELWLGTCPRWNSGSNADWFCSSSRVSRYVWVKCL